MLDMDYLLAACKDGKVIIDNDGIIKTYAWHVKDSDFKVTFTQQSGYKGKIETIYHITDGFYKESTGEYKRALELTERYLKTGTMLVSE